MNQFFFRRLAHRGGSPMFTYAQEHKPVVAYLVEEFKLDRASLTALLYEPERFRDFFCDRFHLPTSATIAEIDRFIDKLIAEKFIEVRQGRMQPGWAIDAAAWNRLPDLRPQIRARSSLLSPIDPKVLAGGHDRVAVWRRTGSCWFNVVWEPVPGKPTRMMIDDPRFTGREFVHFISNNVLGLAMDPRVIAAANAANQKYGTSASGSSALSGRRRLHVELEQALCRYKLGAAYDPKLHECMILPMGFITNVAVCASLANDSLVITDEEIHNSVITGLQSVRSAKPDILVQRFDHNSVVKLRQILVDNAKAVDEDKAVGRTELKSRKGRKAIAIYIESVYSMRGDLAPLGEIFELAREFGARVIIDEAHSTGVLGPSGHGILEELSIPAPESLWLRIGTLSKTLASEGGYVIGPRFVIDGIRHSANAAIFGAMLPPSCAAASLEALRIMEAEPQLVNQLRRNVNHFLLGINGSGLDTLKARTHIVPIRVYNEDNMTAMFESLLREGFVVSAVPTPAVRNKGDEILRIGISAQHSLEELDGLIAALKKAAKQVGLIE